MKKLTILFDADDTVENLSDCWIAMLNERYGTSVTPEDVHGWDISLAFPTLTKEQVFGVLHDDELWRRITPIPGSVEVLQKLYDEGHQLYMVTASSYHTCKTKVERLLELFPFLDWEHIIFACNKQMVRGDVLIDDAPHNLVGGEYAKILFDRPHNRSFDHVAHDALRVSNGVQPASSRNMPFGVRLLLPSSSTSRFDPLPLMTSNFFGWTTLHKMIPSFLWRNICPSRTLSCCMAGGSSTIKRP